MDPLQQEYEAQQCWGLISIINIYGCNPQFIRDPKKIQEFIDALCQSIEMKKYGEAMIQRFAEDELEGYSAMQFIETSSITMHFDEIKDRAFIDIFSCKYFDYKKAERFSREFLEGKESNSQYILRK